MSHGWKRSAPTSEEQFRDFFREHVDRAHRLAWRLLDRDSVAAEDVVQDAFAKAYRGLHRFRGDAKLSTWFHTILVRECRSHRRRQAVRDRLRGAAPPDPPDPRHSPPGDPALRSRLAAALEQLSGGQRDVFVLVYLEEMTLRESAAILGRSEGTIKTHLHRALQKLRSQLDDLDPRGDDQQAQADDGHDADNEGGPG